MKNLIVVLVFTIGLLFSTSWAFGADAKLKDGVYKVTYDKADAHGYKAFLEITVKSGKISAATFDYLAAKDGSLKSKDEKYEKLMKSKTGVGPVEYSKKLVDELLAAQKAEVDVVTGATDSSSDFKILAAAAIKKALAGDLKETAIPLPTKEK